MSAPRRATLPVLTAAVLLAICLVFTFVMANWHHDVGRVLGASSQSVATAVAGEVDRNIERLDFSLRGVAENWRLPEVQNLPQHLRDKVLFGDALQAPGFGIIMVLDADGTLMARSAGDARIGTSFSDRDYFRVHAGMRSLGLYVSRPFKSRISGRMIIVLSRRLEDEAGAFTGVVVGTIDLASLSKLYAGLSLGERDAVTLFRTDGRVIARQPFVEGDVGRWVGGGDAFNRMRASRDGSFEGESPLDGQRRIISYHRVGNLPMIQAIEVSGEAAYADWWWRATAVAGLLTLLCLGVLGLSLGLYRELGRRSSVEAELSRLATTDALTGLSNRRRFERVLDEQWHRAAASDEPLSLVMIDADDFKSYNDLLGHPAGDAVLQAVAERLDTSARGRGGLVYRYGGEEFVAMFPACGEKRALAAAESLRASIEALGLLHPRGIGGVVTISLGVAAARPAKGGGAPELLLAADAALYRAKAAGRNQARASERGDLEAA